MKIVSWILRIVSAAIMAQTLYFKFTGAPESVELFTLIGMEPWGRIGTGVMELIASVLLLVPRTKVMGALLGLGLMSGAIFFHITKVGIDEGGTPLLFIYAVVVFVCCAILLAMHFKEFKKFIPVKRWAAQVSVVHRAFLKGKFLLVPKQKIKDKNRSVLPLALCHLPFKPILLSYLFFYTFEASSTMIYG